MSPFSFWVSDMKYTLEKNRIIVIGKDDFNPEHILECGQVFSFYKDEDGNYIVSSKDKCAKIVETESGFVIETAEPKYFEEYFDLKTDYGQIKKKLSKYEILKSPIGYGFGIRILKQDLFEVVISFIVSANNNIKRIKLILNRIKEKYGSKMNGYFAFPTREQLMAATEVDFAELGAGYRAKYLYEVLRQVDEKTLLQWGELPTRELRKKLLTLMGIGPKVADCVLLFGYGRGDVFPVDTWIEQMYDRFYTHIPNREKVRENLVAEFGEFSGYAQQYLFFFMRAGM